MVITQLFNVLFSFYEGKYTWEKLNGYRSFAPTLVKLFERWLAQYCADEIIPEGLKEISLRCENEKIYQNLQTEPLYAQAIIDYIAGMTDRFAIALFNE